MISVFKQTIRALVPLWARKRLAIAVDRVRPGELWAAELLSDFAENDVAGYHRFLWSHHLSYAETYEIAKRFGSDKLKQTRHMLLADLRTHLLDGGPSPDSVHSILDVGSSMGYVLRFLETDVFPGAQVLDGVDIDGYAVERGQAHLRGIGSRIRLHQADMGALAQSLGDRRYDVVLCLGVLMYLEENAATEVVATMLRHCQGVLAISGPAHPDRDNRELLAPERRRDASLIHNFDRMVEQTGGRVIGRRWEGPRVLDGNTVCFVFARPGDGAESASPD